MVMGRRPGVATAPLPIAVNDLVGLAGSLVHCLGMCGPFVLGQVAGRAERHQGGYGELQRLKQGALLPYHLGRLTTYCGLGAAAGMVGTLFFALPQLRLAAALLLAVAALVLLAQILPKIATILPANRLSARLAVLVARRAGTAPAAGWLSLWRFGLLLGFLPCGFLWGALAAAAASGGPVRGALAMAGFGLGTMPALVGLGWSGALFGRGLWLRRLALPLQSVNAVFLLWMCARVMNGL